MPLIVMLHGCRQDSDAFATGTRMNELAQSRGFIVAYPEQTVRANGGRCWNWFETDQQTRDGEEPNLIAGMVLDISRSYAVDARRVFIAGLSAGAAMAVIMGQTHPDVICGVAAHSGLPRGAAHDRNSAFAAMAGRAAAASTGSSHQNVVRAMPTIVLHGDADDTVSCVNGTAIGEQALAGFKMAGIKLRRATAALGSCAPQAQMTTFTNKSGEVVIAEIVVRGGGHAWFGGSQEGSYTSGNGPDASIEIVRFFEGLVATRPL